MKSTHADGVLMLYHRPSRGQWADADNVVENVTAFPRHSRFRVRSLNTDYGLPPGLLQLEFDAVLVHYSVFLPGPQPYLLGGGFLEYLNKTGAYKIVTFQDEHQWCGKRFAFLNETGIDCVYTMLEPPHGERVYGKYAPGVSRVVSNLPGYVGKELLRAAPRYRKPDATRSIDIGYRGRPMPAYMGEGAAEKATIGERFEELVAGLDLQVDIDVSEDGRLYGTAWHEFVGNSRAQLGVESGVSCFDAEDKVRADWERLAAGGTEPTLAEMHGTALDEWDWKIPYRTISPRNFEAAAFDVCQILFEGHYSGAMVPMRHYIPLKKDFSNFDEVTDRYRDAGLRHKLATNARTDLIESGRYSYGQLIRGFDRVLEEAGLAPRRSPQLSVSRALILPPRVRVARLRDRWQQLPFRHPRAWQAIWVLSRPIAVPIRVIRERLT